MGVNFYFSIPDQNQFIIPCCQKPLHTLALCTPHSAGLCSKETSVAKSRKAHSDKELLQNYYRIIIDLLKNFCMSRKAHSDGLGTLFREGKENPALGRKSKIWLPSLSQWWSDVVLLRYESSTLILYKEPSSSIFQSCQSVSESGIGNT